MHAFTRSTMPLHAHPERVCVHIRVMQTADQPRSIRLHSKHTMHDNRLRLSQNRTNAHANTNTTNTRAMHKVLALGTLFLAMSASAFIPSSSVVLRWSSTVLTLLIAPSVLSNLSALFASLVSSSRLDIFLAVFLQDSFLGTHGTCSRKTFVHERFLYSRAAPMQLRMNLFEGLAKKVRGACIRAHNLPEVTGRENSPGTFRKPSWILARFCVLHAACPGSSVRTF